MTATTALPPDVAAYLAAVRAALADLPDAERNDVLFDVEASLLEAASESEGQLVARLGAPEDFTAELRAAAGLQPPPGPGPADRGSGWRDSLAQALHSPRAVATRRRLAELAPLWWAARGYVAVAAVALLAGASWLGSPAAVPRLGDGRIGVATVLVAVAASIALGLYARGRRELGRPILVANAVLLVAAVPVAAHLARYEQPRPVVNFTMPVSQELTYLGLRVENIYPYSRDGKLLHDVLLYDGAGRPLRIAHGAHDPLRRLVQTSAGRVLYNTFPIRYFEPGTLRVANPNAAPRDRVPRVATPPLTAERRANRR